MRKITAKLLKDQGACVKQLRAFKQRWPKGVIPTRELAINHAKRFDWDWAAYNLLSAPALAEYDRIRASAWVEYGRVCASAWGARERVCAPALAEYDRVCGSARAEYDRIRATTFVDCLELAANALNKGGK